MRYIACRAWNFNEFEYPLTPQRVPISTGKGGTMRKILCLALAASVAATPGARADVVEVRVE